MIGDGSIVYAFRAHALSPICFLLLSILPFEPLSTMRHRKNGNRQAVVIFDSVGIVFHGLTFAIFLIQPQPRPRTTTRLKKNTTPPGRDQMRARRRRCCAGESHRDREEGATVDEQGTTAMTTRWRRRKRLRVASKKKRRRNQLSLLRFRFCHLVSLGFWNPYFFD